MLPSVEPHSANNNLIFHQDNYSYNHNINVLDWANRSPDLNPIENMWGLLVKHVRQRRVILRNREALLTAITEAWQALAPRYHRNLSFNLNAAMTKY
jgi:hypothetical protein